MNGKQMEGVRQRRSREEVERLVDEYEASGLGRQQFCKKHGLSLTTLNRHRKRKQFGQEKETPERRFIPVEISAAKQQASKERSGELLVWLSSGRRIEVRGGFDARVLGQLVRVLEQA
jgi:transposase-like protein